MGRIPWVYLILAFVVSGCASMSGQGSFQTVLVQSQPPGASIFVGGKKVGRTPDFVDVTRSRRPEIEIESIDATSRNTRRKIELETSYRWSKSFARNLIFVSYAPVGWFVDIFTGAAWEIADAPPIPVVLSESDARAAKAQKRPMVTVVAPPQAESQVLSDAGGRALEKVLREQAAGEKSPRELLAYDRTVSAFLAGGYEYEIGESSARRRFYRDVYGTFKADLVYESRIDRTSTGWVLKSRAQSLFSSHMSEGPTIELARDEQGSRILGFGLQPWWARILPNTVGLDWVSDSVRMEFNGLSYELDSARSDEWWAQGLEYLSAINISSTPDWRRSFGSRWEFSAIPSFRISRKNVRAKNLPPPSNGQFVEKDPQFLRWSVSGGYGFELGYLANRHYFYFDIIPVFNWSQVSWRQNSANIAATRTTITAQVELGYTYVFDSNWLLRIFSRSQGENVEVWRDAFRTRLGDDYAPTGASGIVSGLTVGYRFDSVGYRAQDRKTAASGR